MSIDGVPVPNETDGDQLRQAPIYLVDDDQAIVSATEFLLETHGFTVHSFTSPVKFLDAIGRSTGPGCVLLDMTMPQMSGLSVQKKLTGTAPHLAVVIMTGRATYSNCADAMKLGAFDIVEKPFQGANLIDQVRRYLDEAMLRWSRSQEKKRFRSYYETLTLRERQVYSRLLVGDQTKQLAYKLEITVSTAEKHVRNVLRKFEADSPVRLILMSVEHGDVDMEADSPGPIQ